MDINALRDGFLHPPAGFSPLPFWFWNDTLSEAELTRQIDDFLAHGVSGFVIHPRRGLDPAIGYMTDRWLHFVRHAVEEAARRGMQVILYDEGMYPSGSAHGMVASEDPDLAAWCLTAEALPDLPEAAAPFSPEPGVYCAPHAGKWYRFREEHSGGTIRGLFPGEDDGEPHAPPAADLLNPRAVQAFIRLTHERYYAAMPEYFGSTITAFFTDEPDLLGRNAKRGAIPWTQGFLAEFGDMGVLPALFFGSDGPSEAIRRRYRRAIRTRLLRTYYQPLADWCAAHGVALTGHPAHGADVRLLSPFHIPGQDVVWRQVYPGSGLTGGESVAAKAAADHARHTGKRRCAVEYLGCCGPEHAPWGMTAADLKWYTDFLLARGVNLLIPHAFYYSIRGDRRSERPPDVGPHNTWWPFFGAFAAYMRRMCFLLTGSADQARIAVLCGDDSVPWECCIPLYEQLAPFCYLEAELLAECTVGGGALCLREQRFTHVVPDASVCLSPAQQERLAEFAASGGVIIPGSDVSTRIGEMPAIRVCPPCSGLRITHLLRDGKHLYLIFNQEEPCARCTLTIPEAGRAQWWDPWQGTIRPARRCGENRFSLTLPRFESIVLCIDPAAPDAPVPDDAGPWDPLPAGPARPVRTGCWTLTRADGVSVTLPAEDGLRLPGWETIPGWERYSGTVAFETVFRPDAAPAIDLGRVHGVARAWADGVFLGCRLWPPFRFPLPPSDGPVRLRIEVTNTPANALDGVPLPSGIAGPP